MSRSGDSVRRATKGRGVLLALGGCLLAVSAGAGSLHLKATATAAGILASVADVVEEAGLSADDRAELAGLYLGEAPRAVTREQVARRLETAGPRWQGWEVRGITCEVIPGIPVAPPAVILVRREEAARDAILAEWRRRVSDPDVIWSLEAREPLGDFAGWAGAGLSVLGVRGDFSTRSGQHLFLLEWREGTGPVRVASLSYDCRARKRSLVTSRPLPRGAVLAAADLEPALVEWDFSRPRRQDPVCWVGWAVRRDLPAGTLLREEMVEKQWLVTPGGKVRLVVRQRRFTMETSGVARERGAAGDLVRVENPASGRLILARVAGPGLVEVTNGGGP